MKGETIGAVAAFVVFAFFGLFTVWFTYFAPCSWHEGDRLKDTPLRCIEEGKGR